MRYSYNRLTAKNRLARKNMLTYGTKMQKKTTLLEGINADKSRILMNQIKKWDEDCICQASSN